MDAVPLEKAPKVAIYAPPNAAPWDDAVTMALQYAGIKFEKVWDQEVTAGRAASLRLAAPASRGFHRPVFQVLSELCRVALAGRHGGPKHQDGAVARVTANVPAREASGGEGHRRVRRTGWLSLRHVHGDRNPRPRPGQRRSGHRGELCRQLADGSQRELQDGLGPGVRLPGRESLPEPDGFPVLRHRRAPGELG